MLHYLWGGDSSSPGYGEVERVGEARRMPLRRSSGGREVVGRGSSSSACRGTLEADTYTHERRGGGRSRMDCRSEATRRGSSRRSQEECGGEREVLRAQTKLLLGGWRFGITFVCLSPGRPSRYYSYSTSHWVEWTKVTAHTGTTKV